MKKSMQDFWKANGFYVSFGFGIVALVAALAVYNVNSRKGRPNQNINLNEPMELNVADADVTKDNYDAVNGDLDVPMDMQTGKSNPDVEEPVVETTVIPSGSSDRKEELQPQSIQEEAQMSVEVNEGMANADVSGEEAAGMEETVDVISPQVVAYTPLENLEFIGMEEVSMPVLGNTILPFSMDTTVYYKTLGVYRCNPGMLLQAPVGTDVVSIWHGQVTDIKDTKEYGTTVTVNLGSGYELVYGQLKEVRVDVGDEVYKDTILGVVAEPTAYYQEEGSHVFLKMTKDGEPIDPMDVLQLE